MADCADRALRRRGLSAAANSLRPPQLFCDSKPAKSVAPATTVDCHCEPMNRSTSLRNPQHRVYSREAAIELQPRAKPWEIDDTSSSPAGTIESRSAVPPERQSPSTSVHSVLDRG